MPNAVNTSRLAVPISGSSKIGTASAHVTNKHGTTPRTSERSRSPIVESFAARKTTSASLANSDGSKLNAWVPSQRREPPELCPTCGMSTAMSKMNATPRPNGATERNLR